jgi:hypothetical protein
MLNDSPSSKNRKSRLKAFFDADNIARRKKERENKHVADGAEFMTEAMVREIVKTNNANGFKKMEDANKRVYATKTMIAQLAKINEFGEIENKLDDNRMRGDRCKTDYLPQTVEYTMELRDRLETQINKMKEENASLDNKIIDRRKEWLTLQRQVNADMASAENKKTLEKAKAALLRQIERTKEKLDLCNANNTQILREIAEHRKERVTAMEIYRKQALNVQRIEQGSIKLKRKKWLPEEIKAQLARKSIRRMKKSILRNVRKFEHTRDALKVEIERETETAKTMRRMSLSESKKYQAGGKDRAEEMLMERESMKKSNLLRVMRRVSTKSLQGKVQQMLGTKEMFMKIVEIKRRFGEKGDVSFASPTNSEEAADRPPSRKEMQGIIDDFEIRGQQLDSLMQQNNELAKQVEEKTKRIMELEERIVGDAKIKKRLEMVHAKEGHLNSINARADEYTRIYQEANEMLKELKPCVHRIFTLLNCGNSGVHVSNDINNVYFEHVNPSHDPGVICDLEVEGQPLSFKRGAEKVIKANRVVRTMKTVHRDDVFFYHNPMLALGVIEMQCKNLILNRGLAFSNEYIEEPALSPKPDDKNSPLKRVIKPTSNEFIVPELATEEPPQYHNELRSEAAQRRGMGVEEFGKRQKIEQYRSKGRRKIHFNLKLHTRDLS